MTSERRMRQGPTLRALKAADRVGDVLTHDTPVRPEMKGRRRAGM